MRQHGSLSRGVFAVAVLVSLAVLFAPAADVPPAPDGVDKLVHAALFCVLALTGRWAGVGSRVLGGALVGYAVTSELLQGALPLGRSASVWDALADVVGILLGLALWRTAGQRAAVR